MKQHKLKTGVGCNLCLMQNGVSNYYFFLFCFISLSLRFIRKPPSFGPLVRVKAFQREVTSVAAAVAPDESNSHKEKIQAEP